MAKYTALLSRTVLDDGVSLNCIISSIAGRELTEYVELAPVRFAAQSRLQAAIARASGFGHSALETDTAEPIDVSKEQLIMLGFTRLPE